MTDGNAIERGARGLSRRGMLGLLGAGGAGLALGGAGGAFAGAQIVRGERAARAHPFHGEHQRGVTTLSPDALVLASLDMVDGATVDDLRDLLADWTYAASRLTQGLEVAEDGATGTSPEAPPPDSGEALGLDAAGLTLTFGSSYDATIAA